MWVWSLEAWQCRGSKKRNGEKKMGKKKRRKIRGKKYKGWSGLSCDVEVWGYEGVGWTRYEREKWKKRKKIK